jgi:hypothetical protein
MFKELIDLILEDEQEREYSAAEEWFWAEVCHEEME